MNAIPENEIENIKFYRLFWLDFKKTSSFIRLFQFVAKRIKYRSICVCGVCVWVSLYIVY